VRAESPGPGCGATFTLSFPIPALDASAVDVESGDTHVSLRCLRVLVVEDDIGLPDEDGYELIRQVRTLERHDNARMPAIAVTALAEPSGQDKALAAGDRRCSTRAPEDQAR
jgi:CheY-like chemotaxis protein